MSFLVLRAPPPSGGGGALSDGSAFTANGSSFGTRTTGVESLAGLGGFIDSLSNGDRFDLQSRPGWSLLTPSTATYPHVSTERSWSRGKSMAFDVRGTNEYKQSMFFDTGVSGYSRMYTNAVIYYTHDALLGGNYLQWKMQRWVRTQTVVDGDGCYMSNRQGTAGGFFTWFNSMGQTVSFYDTEDGGQALPDGGSYVRWETWLRLNSSPGTADGVFHMRASNPTTGAVIAENAKTNIAFNGAGDSGVFRYVVLQNFFGNASDGNPLQQDNANAAAWWDDIYISYGLTDDAFAHGILTDSSTLASAAFKEIQPMTSWSDTALGMNLNQGALSNLTGKSIIALRGVPEAQAGSAVAVA